jgi:hypothetical protein
MSLTLSMLLHAVTSPALPTGAMILPRYASVSVGGSDPISVVVNVHDLEPPVTVTGLVCFCGDPRSAYVPPVAVHRCVTVHCPVPVFRHEDPAYEIVGAWNPVGADVAVGFGFGVGLGVAFGFDARDGDRFTTTGRFQPAFAT